MYFSSSLYKRFRDFPWRAAMLGKPYAFVTGTLISIVLIVVTIFYLRSETTRSHEQARHAAESIASLVQHHIDRDFAKIGVFLRTIRNDRMLDRTSGDRRTNSGINELFRLFPEIEALVVCDRSGTEIERFVRTNSDEIKPVVWPLEGKPEPMSDIQLSGPFRSPYSGQWVLTLAIDLVTPGGEKEGYAFVSIQSSSYFTSALSQLKIGQYGAATIRKRDFSLIYRSLSLNDAVIGSKNISREIQESFQRSPNDGTFLAKTALDGIERVNAYRKIGQYPLYVIVGLATDENLKHWLVAERVITGLAGLSVALLLILSLTYSASAHRQHELNIRLAGQTEKLSAIFEACSEGIHILDLNGRLIKANAAFYRLIGRSEHENHISISDWSPENARLLIAQFSTLPSGPVSEAKRPACTFSRTTGDQLQVQLGVTKFVYDGQPAICASARDITAEKRNLEMLQYMLSEYRELNDELEFRAKCCEVTHGKDHVCLASAIPGMLADWQKLLCVLGALQPNAAVTTEADYAALMDRAAHLLDAMSEIVHRVHYSCDFDIPASA